MTQDESYYLSKLPGINPEPVLLFDTRGEIEFRNDSAKTILDNIHDIYDIFPYWHSRDLVDIIASGKNHRTTYQAGEEFYYLHCIPTLDGSGLAIFSTNITDLLRTQHQLQEAACHDHLTGIFNRHQLLEDIKARQHAAFLLLLDIAGFADINSYFGYRLGDNYLLQFTQLLRSFLQSYPNIHLYRVSGDVFALFGSTDTGLTEPFVAKLKAYLRQQKIVLDHLQLWLEYTMGLAKYKLHNQSTTRLTLFNRAEAALTEAKRRELSFLSDSSIRGLEQTYKDNLLWAQKSLNALHNSHQQLRIQAYFQPILHLSSNRIEKYEALARLVDHGTVMPPLQFLEAMKRTRLLPRLTTEMATQSAMVFADNSLEFSLNVGIQDLRDEHMLSNLLDILSQQQVAPERVVIEILEDGEIYQLLDTINEYKASGFKIAIDDFGTGYSNFSKLQQLSVDYLKIDGSLIKDIANSQRACKIAQTINDYARQINAKTIAEFVADEAILEMVRSIGIDYAQGYHIGVPDPKLLEGI